MLTARVQHRFCKFFFLKRGFKRGLFPPWPHVPLDPRGQTEDPQEALRIGLIVGGAAAFHRRYRRIIEALTALAALHEHVALVEIQFHSAGDRLLRLAYKSE